MVAVAFIAGLYLWFHQSVAAVQAHTKDAKEAQTVLGKAPEPGHAAIALVIGYDHRANESANTPSRSDTVMLIRTDPSNHTVSMMSFPRDMIVNVHCPGQPVFSGKINSAYANCGSKGTVQTVSDLIGLPINYLITVNFRGFKKIVNTLGGVWIDVDRRYLQQQRRPVADLRLRQDQPPARLPEADRRERARLRALPAHRLGLLPGRPPAAVREGDEVPARP